MPKKRKQRLLVLWNQSEPDVYERFQEEGARPLDWDPERMAAEVTTVQDEMDAFIDALRDGPLDVVCVNVEDDIDRLIAAIRLHQPDVIFNLVEFFYDDETLEPNIAGLYELFDVPYTGNTPHTLAACQRKGRTKLLLEDAGLPIASYTIVHREPVPRPEDLELRYPLIVKPANEDASGGIEPESVVHDYDALVERCRYLLTEFEQPALVEEYIEGREIHAAVLGNERPEVLPLFEMEFDDSEFNPDDEWRPQIISYSAKWDPHSKDFYSMEPVCPAEGLGDEVEARIRDVAVAAYRVMGCRDYARIDMRVDDKGQPFILEVNPNPDLADGSAYMMCAEQSGRSYAQTLLEITKMALSRGHVPEEPAEEARSASTDLMNRKYSKRPTPRACPKCGAALPHRSETAPPERAETAPNEPAKTGSTSG
jgi:D-alanine-D-alanine ligase